MTSYFSISLKRYISPPICKSNVLCVFVGVFWFLFVCFVCVCVSVHACVCVCVCVLMSQ